jgi:glycosyltransferase involved in cell wall biosynthesis
MHVVLIEFSTSLAPYSVQLANALGKLCQITLMLPDTSGDLVNQVDQQNVNLKLFRKPRMRQLANLNMIRRLRRQIQDMQPDLVHIPSLDIWGTPGLGLFFPIPIVATVHDVERHPGEHGLWGFPSAVYPWQWRWAKQIIVHATNSRQQLLNKYGRQADRVHVIPIGAYSFYSHWAVDNQPEKPNTLLFFGRIWGYKGLQYLIDAEPLISRSIPGVRIIIAGQGEPIEKYKRSMVNPDRFEVHDQFIPNEEVAALFQQASLVVLPYIEASQSAVVTVAYAFGKPVVATRVGGLPDVVLDGQTGLLVPPADARSLAEAVIKLLKDSTLRYLMGQNAKRFSEGELSWDKVAEKTLKVYQLAQKK